MTHCGVLPDGYVAFDGDCDDDDETVSPEVICDGLENECNSMNEIVLPNSNLTNGVITISEDTRFCVQNSAIVQLSVNIWWMIFQMYPYSNNSTTTTLPPTITCYPDGLTNDFIGIHVDNQNFDIDIDGITFEGCMRAPVISAYGTGQINIASSTFSDNSNNNEGGAIYIKSSDNTDFPELNIKNSNI